MTGVDLASVRRLAAATSSVPARLEASLAVPALCDEIEALRAVVEQVRALAEGVYTGSAYTMAWQLRAILHEPNDPERVHHVPHGAE